MYILEVHEVGRVLYEWRKHSHIYWEITIATYGTATIYSNLGNFELNMGDVLIIPPDVAHSFSSKNGYKDRSIYIDEMKLNNNVLHFIKGNNHNFINHSKRLMEAYKKEKEGINCSFEEKSKFFLRHIMNILTKEQNTSLDEKVRNYINVNFSTQITEKTLSVYFKYNGNYIRRSFKKRYGLTPIQYLSFVRLSQAKNLLEFAKNCSINEISLQCGFPDQLYFSRFFKKHTGVSPLEYRNNTFKA